MTIHTHSVIHKKLHSMANLQSKQQLVNISDGLLQRLLKWSLPDSRVVEERRERLSAGLWQSKDQFVRFFLQLEPTPQVSAAGDLCPSLAYEERVEGAKGRVLQHDGMRDA